MQELSVVGKSVPKVDAVEKVTGIAKFSGDVKLAGMLYGKIKRSPHAHARVLAVDTSKAEQLPGVKAVLTIDDVPRVLHSGTRTPERDKFRFDKYIIDEKVRFVGDGMAAVAAVSEEVAEEALELIEVKYEVLPAVFDPEEAMKPGAPKVHDDVEKNLAWSPLEIKYGDVEKGFQEADYIFEDRFVTSRQVHCFLEPFNCVCQFDRLGNLTVWTAAQSIFSAQGVLSEVLGIPLAKIRVISEHVGGGFGGKMDIYQLELICALLARKTGKPVKIEYTREETFTCGRTRHPAILYLKQGVKKDGTLTARQARVITDTGAFAEQGPMVTRVLLSKLASLYKCPNMDVVGYCVYTNLPIAGAFRGYGGPQAMFALESQMRIIADKLAMDPMELRLKNRVRVGDMGLSRLPIDSCGLEECIRVGAERIGWKEKRMNRVVSGMKKKGVGMACFIHISGSFPFSPDRSSAFINFSDDATVTLIVGAQDLGTGLKTTLTQIAAEELGVPFEDISIVAGDTNVCPYDRGTYASGTLFIAGGAVKAAAADAKGQLLGRAAKMLEVTVDDLESGGGKFWVKSSPQKAVSIKDVVHHAITVIPGESIMGKASFAPYQAYPFGAQFAEVEVDTESGQVTLLKMVAAHDMGKAINPVIVEGQMEGGLQNGMGYALTEDMVVDEETGAIVNPGFLDYKMFTALDMPEIVTIIVEPGDPHGPFGAKGVGEPGMMPTAAAIANAVYDAVGVRIKELPITSDKVLRALKEKKGQGA